MLVIDATHGGLTLSAEYALLGHRVTCADIHRTVPAAERRRYQGGFEIVDSLPDVGSYDLIVSPMHFNRKKIEGAPGRIISHHDAVRELLSGSLDYPICEITGSFGKTTALWAAVSILCQDRSVLAMCSDGIFLVRGGKRRQLVGNISTTPANILRAVRACTDGVDLGIFEVSLGGTGLAELGIIKNVYDNYPIAQGTSDALTAKRSMIENARQSSTVLINGDDPLLRGMKGVSKFSSLRSGCEVMAEAIKIGAGGIEFDAVFDGFGTARGRQRVRADPRLFGRQHVENLLVGVAIAAFFGMGDAEIEKLRNLGSFGSKMVIEGVGAKVKVVNRSSSISPKSLQASISDFLEVFHEGGPLYVGGRLKTTCGAADPEGVAKVIDSEEHMKPVALFGDFGGEIRGRLNRKDLVSPEAIASGPSLWVERG